MIATSNIQIHHCIQGDDEWHELRSGRLGGTSSAVLLVDGRGPDGFGAGLHSLLYRKAAEILVGWAEPVYMNDDMQRGIDLEPLARRRYEDERFVTVQEVGYVSRGEFLGHSPDGLIGNDGMIEIKCPAAPEFVRYAIERNIKPEYIAQMQWGMWLADRKWCDFVVWHPDFKPGDMIVTRVHADADVHAKFTQRVPIYINRLRSIVDGIKKA